MADKKPEKKEASKTMTHTEFLYMLGAGVLIFLFISSVLSNASTPFGKLFQIFSTDSSHSSKSLPAYSADGTQYSEGYVIPLNDSFLSFLFSPANTYPAPGTLSRNTPIVTERKTVVRVEAGGPIVGTQDKGARGQIMSGPLLYNGIRYFQVHYDEVPDGWVREADITRYISTYYAINFLPGLFSVLRSIAFCFTFLFGFLILYTSHKNSLLDKQEIKTTKKSDNVKEEAVTIAPVQNERWLGIMSMLESHNQSDWRQAIIEADILLEEMLDRMGYVGSTIADKLKTIEPSDFTTLDDAWEAHKVRNRIAHDGKEYALANNEARRVIGLYEKVFKEFYFI